jgi:hypothetical protein
MAGTSKPHSAFSSAAIDAPESRPALRPRVQSDEAAIHLWCSRRTLLTEDVRSCLDHGLDGNQAS